jgi:hypothetical protein
MTSYWRTRFLLEIGLKLVRRPEIRLAHFLYKVEWESLSQCPTLIYVAGHPLEPAQIPPKKQLEDRLCTKSRNYYRIYTTFLHHIAIDLTFSIELFIGLYKQNFSRITLPDLGLNWMLTNFCTKYFKVRSTNKVFLLSSSDPSV